MHSSISNEATSPQGPFQCGRVKSSGLPSKLPLLVSSQRTSSSKRERTRTAGQLTIPELRRSDTQPRIFDVRRAIRKETLVVRVRFVEKHFIPVLRLWEAPSTGMKRNADTTLGGRMPHGQDASRANRRAAAAQAPTQRSVRAHSLSRAWGRERKTRQGRGSVCLLNPGSQRLETLETRSQIMSSADLSANTRHAMSNFELNA